MMIEGHLTFNDKTSSSYECDEFVTDHKRVSLLNTCVFFAGLNIVKKFK